MYSKKLKVGRPVEIQKGLFLCLSGMGHERAIIAANKLLALRVDGVISWGVAGAIEPTINAGDLILASAIIKQDSRYTTTSQWHDWVFEYLQQSSANLINGDIVSSKEACASTADKKKLFDATGALAVDMESAAIAEIAMKNNLDFLVLRAIADNAHTHIPEAVLNHTNYLGQPAIFNFTLSCLLKTTQIREILILAKAYRKGLASLSRIAPGLKNQHFFYSDDSLP